MLDDAEGLHRLPRHALGGRIQGDELRVPLLSSAQLAHELVVLGVADFGAIEDVVAVVVVADLGAQLLDAELGGG
jgi:hypothetical protein